MPTRNRNGYVFYENQNYLRKLGTDQFFVYTKALAAREDMINYNPFAIDTTKEVKLSPGVDMAEHRSNLTKDFIGLTRDEIRATVKTMNRAQRMLWALDLLCQQMPIRDYTQFNPSRIDVMKIIGPPVSGADLLQALEKYKTNPTNIKYLLDEAALANPPEPEGAVLIQKDAHDPLAITHPDLG